AAKEPEIEDLANFLNAMGARVSASGTDRIAIEGVKTLHGATHNVIPDRIETGTYMIAAAMTQGDVTLRRVCAEHLTALLTEMKQAGIQVENKKESIRVVGPRVIRPVNIAT